MYQGFIFDIDHTLINSDAAHLEAALQAFNEFGLERTEADFMKYFDKATDEIFRLVAGSDHQYIAGKIAARKTVLFLEKIGEIEIYHGVEALFRKIKQWNGKIVLASNNFDIIIEKMMQQFHWGDLCEGFVGIDHVTHRKPHPEMINKSIKILELEPSQVIMIGDSPYDIEAGIAAGTHTAALLTGHHPREAFLKLNPDYIAQDIMEITRFLEETHKK